MKFSKIDKITGYHRVIFDNIGLEFNRTYNNCMTIGFTKNPSNCQYWISDVFKVKLFHDKYVIFESEKAQKVKKHKMKLCFIII